MQRRCPYLAGHCQLPSTLASRSLKRWVLLGIGREGPAALAEDNVVKEVMEPELLSPTPSKMEHSHGGASVRWTDFAKATGLGWAPMPTCPRRHGPGPQGALTNGLRSVGDATLNCISCFHQLLMAGVGNAIKEC